MPEQVPSPRVQFRLYPLVDQIADKVAAMTEVHSGGRRSTRSRDLVDIVTYASTQAFESRPLAQAIAAEMRLRRLPDDDIAGRIPAEDWRARYAVEAARITHCRRHPTISDAVDLVRTFIDDALAETTAAKRWNPDLLEWERTDPTPPPPRRG
ncbi:nucleotidyl transferase AbiEii/AbiGii toxin family protein [Brevibacterium sp. XM4083]|uniref:nucleotidyl transferase AbiEii/AbiGii toxin family protein n=1 Tax=Brevibacterium sp. XM4083 TaxID=2583238 RepID=UPI0024B59175|nr:nucleotidyl transferase AbiEii/AbiGii toxin family protein [Brevibacterium sp. 2SA]